MFRIGIDVGSTYTKYCIVKDGELVELFNEKTPVHQNEYFKEKIKDLRIQYSGAEIVSCGYGKNNVDTAVKCINELTALAKGSFFLTKEASLVLDIGGQDTKIIKQENGILTSFFINDKCAAGSGMFLTSTLERINKGFSSINLCGINKPEIKLSSVCAVFAQSEIVSMIADNRTEEEIINAVIWQILISSKKLLTKVNNEPLLLSGGLTAIPGFCEYAEKALERDCTIMESSPYLSAIGCAVSS